MPDLPVIVWFRDDLRLSDNPALSAAVASGRPIIPLFILDEESDGVRPLGGAQRWWLHGSLVSLAEAIAARGGSLLLKNGSAGPVLDALVGDTKAVAVYWNRRYGAARSVDALVKSSLGARQVEARSFNAALLAEPWDLPSHDRGGYKVFSPFWRGLRAQLPGMFDVTAAPARLVGPELDSDRLEDWRLRPTKPDWSADMAQVWTRGEQAAQSRLEEFLDTGLKGYSENRDRPDLPATSRLSPYLRWGEIGPRQVWNAVARHSELGRTNSKDAEKFLSELAWREFSYHLLYHAPDLPSRNWRSQFDAMPWRSTDADIERWRRGRTGVPLVDAGMRELWSTGWMHNRVRMVTASFLTKHLLTDWRVGEAWFWDTLVDADEANNAASWQWVAGCGADAAPYFRVFNPVLQGERFDPEGRYVRRWVEELAATPIRSIHSPWLAARPPTGYPAPVISLEAGRDRALKAFQSLKDTAITDEGTAA